VRGREEDLLEADDVGVEQRAVVDQLALDVAVDLLGVVWWGMEGKRESCEVSKFLSKGPAFFFFLFSLSLSSSPLLLSLLTLSPRSINLTATSSPVALSRISLATPKLPEPMSLIWELWRE
jgi:hypothetical protein